MKLVSNSLALALLLSPVSPLVTFDVQAAEGSKAVVVLHPTKGNATSGQLTITSQGNVAAVTGVVQGLSPGEHGMHIHEWGDCRAADGSSAGAHFNPKGTKHGGVHGGERHAGDLGNITADANGLAKVQVEAVPLQVENIIGRSIIVHATADDLKTDPSGNSGGRIACGVIGLANE